MQFLDRLLSAEADGREYGVHRGEQERRDDDGREAEPMPRLKYFGMKNSAISVSRRMKNEPCVCPTGEENQIGWPFLYCFRYT